MIIKNTIKWSRYSLFDALIYGVIAFILVTALMNFAGPNFYSIHPYKFYFFAATILTYYFGYFFASIFIILTSIYANLYFIAPFGVFTLTADEFERFLINVLFGGVAIFFIELLQRQRFKSKLLLLVSESRYLILLNRDNQLLQELKRNK